MKYDIKRAIRLNLILTWGFVVLFTVTAYINGGPEYGKKAMMATVFAGTLATGVYFLPIKDIVKGIIMACIPMVGALGLSIVAGGVDRMFNLYILGLVMVALYFRFVPMLIYGAFWSIVISALFLISPVSLLGPDHATLGEFIPRMGAYLSCYLVLVFLTKWGTEILQTTVLESNRAQNSYEELGELFKSVNQTVDGLSLQVSKCNERITLSAESSEGIASSMREVAASVESSSERISTVSRVAQKSSQDVKRTSEVMSTIEEQFKSVIEDVDQSEESIGAMKGQVDRIKDTVDSSHDTVKELSERMQEIARLLQGITSISEQTNLLALNASIEAARAGEHGRGFAVVADEIRKLSEESGKLANGIQDITNILSKSTMQALEEVGNGRIAVTAGYASMDELRGRFGNMKGSFVQVSSQIEVEFKLVQAVSEQFKVIDSEIAEVAAFLQEYSATTEEVSAQTEMQLNLSQEVVDYMGQIVNSGKALKDMAHIRTTENKHDA